MRLWQWAVLEYPNIRTRLTCIGPRVSRTVNLRISRLPVSTRWISGRKDRLLYGERLILCWVVFIVMTIGISWILTCRPAHLLFTGMIIAGPRGGPWVWGGTCITNLSFLGRIWSVNLKYGVRSG